MSDVAAKQTEPVPEPDVSKKTPAKLRRRHTAWKWLGSVVLVIGVLLCIGRAILPYTVTWYVNRIIDRSPLYDGKIDSVEIQLYRGAYAIRGVRINKKTGNVPVPLFRADRVDLAIEWPSLWARRVVGVVKIVKPEINFVDAAGDGGGDGGNGNGQSGAGGPWLDILRDLFPFKINGVKVVDGSVHFRTYQGQVPVDVYLSSLEASVDNLTNIRDETTPLVTTIKANALAMGQARVAYEMKLDPFSYKPTFHMTTRVLNLDVTKLNDLARTYGNFDFERGWFDLVVDVDANEGLIDGYVKPLFRNLQVLDIRKDAKEDNPIDFFWEALVGGAQELLKNHPRDQFGTLIPFTGDLSAPKTDLLGTVGNLLRNAFIRAYLPRLENGARDADELRFGTAAPIEPVVQTKVPAEAQP